MGTLVGMSDEASRKREAAEKIVSVLHDAGHVAYLAGGCVRDMLLGVEAKDYDVATDATPEQVAALFRKTRHVGEAFGVMLVRLMQCEVEVATFRTDLGYTDGRRPDNVAFTDAAHDAARRDFTINGLFYDPAGDRVIDYVGGQEDLQCRVIRAIGDADARFGEDYLRMLRAVRFAARLDFAIDPATEAAIRKHAAKLAAISRERIGMEMRLILTGPNAARGIERLQDLTLDAPVFDEPHRGRPMPMLRHMHPPGAGAGVGLALASVLIDRHLDEHGLHRIKAVQIIRRWRKALNLSNDERDRLAALMRGLPEALAWNDATIARKKRLLARAEWDELAALLDAYTQTHGSGDATVDLSDIRRLRAEGVAPPPLLTGDDLIAAGFEPGPAFKAILEQVYDAQLELRIETKDQALKMAGRLEA